MDFAHVKRVTRSVGGKEITFRSLLEYRYAVYLQVLSEGGEIQEWDYEVPSYEVEFEHGRRDNVRGYLPDFVVYKQDSIEIHECKGYFPPIDYTKIRRFVDGEARFVTPCMAECSTDDYPFVLIFARKPSKTKGQLLRAQRLEKYFEGTENRIIWNADKDIFKRISGRFSEF